MSKKKQDLLSTLTRVYARRRLLNVSYDNLERVLSEEFRRRGFIPTSKDSKGDSSSDGSSVTRHCSYIGLVNLFSVESKFKDRKSLSWARRISITLPDNGAKGLCSVVIKLEFKNHNNAAKYLELMESIPDFSFINFIDIGEIFDLLTEFVVASDIPEESKENQEVFKKLISEITRLVEELGTGFPVESSQ